MILQKEKTELHYLQLAKGYGDFLLRERTPGLGWKPVAPELPGLLQWNNPENIETGTSGLLLFLLELYTHTKEPRFLQAVDESLAQLVEYCRQTPTGNYSLYTGRGGVIYLLLQRHRLNGNQQLLADALELIRPANHRFLQSRYTTDYLYNGRAGTLLLLLQLYKLTSESFLLQDINAYIDQLVKNARMAAKGICWMNEEELNIRPSCGFAQGAAGIRYALQQLSVHVQHPALELLISRADDYLASCWVDNFDNWGNYEKAILSPQALDIYKARFAANDARLFEPRNDHGWASGTAGLLLSEAAGGAREKAAAALEQMELLSALPSDNLYDGRAGVGLYFIASGRYEQAKQLADALLSADFNFPGKLDTAGGLMHGQAGVLYFLLKVTQPGLTAENILAPFLHTPALEQPILPLSLKTTEVRKTFAAELYPRTVLLLETMFPALLQDYLQTATGNDDERIFSGFVETTLRRKLPYARYERVLDLFNMEKQKLAFVRAETRGQLMIYLHDLHFQDKVSGKLNNPKEWLLRQPIYVSPNIGTTRSRWNWSLIEDFKVTGTNTTIKKFTMNFNEPPAQFMYFLQVFGKLDVTEVCFTEITLLLWEQFKQPKTISAALKDIEQVLRTMPANSWQRWLLPELNHKKIASLNDLLEELDWLVLKYLKPLLYRNILVFQD